MLIGGCCYYYRAKLAMLDKTGCLDIVFALFLVGGRYSFLLGWTGLGWAGLEWGISGMRGLKRLGWMDGWDEGDG